jgi:hypothetical protein
LGCVYIIFQETFYKETIGGIMNTTQDYFESDQEREEGHVDTREQNFECENKDPHLGCDLGIDVQG